MTKTCRDSPEEELLKIRVNGCDIACLQLRCCLSTWQNIHHVQSQKFPIHWRKNSCDPLQGRPGIHQAAWQKLQEVEKKSCYVTSVDWIHRCFLIVFFICMGKSTASLKYCQGLQHEWSLGMATVLQPSWAHPEALSQTSSIKPEYICFLLDVAS